MSTLLRASLSNDLTGLTLSFVIYSLDQTSVLYTVAANETPAGSACYSANVPGGLTVAGDYAVDLKDGSGNKYASAVVGWDGSQIIAESTRPTTAQIAATILKTPANLLATDDAIGGVVLSRDQDATALASMGAAFNGPIITGTVQASASNSTTVFQAPASGINLKVGMDVRFLTGTAANVGLTGRIVSIASGNLVTLDGAFPAAITADDTFEVLGYGQ